jgi:hypothetical protein
VGDLLRDAGLKYAWSLPVTLAGLAAALVFIGWLAHAVYENEILEDSRKPIFLGLAVAAIVVIVQVPTAYTQAKRHCEDLWDEVQGPLVDTTLDTSNNTAYIAAGCHNVWPTGP